MRLKKYRDIAAELAPRKVQVGGMFKMVATKLDGTQRTLAVFSDSDMRVDHWFSNLVTDVGLNQMGIGAFRNLCVVGTGSNAPTATDVQLQTTRARTGNSAPNIPGTTAQSTPPYFTQTNTGFRFSVGSASGNLSEVGIGWSTGSGLTDYQLFARALIKDQDDNPTTVTVLGDEVLDVYYALRIYPPTEDVEYSININDTPYNCISRAASVTSIQHWAVPSGRVQFTAFVFGTAPVVYNGNIGSITAAPSGQSAFNASINNLAYSNNSLRQDATLSWGLDQGNVSGGIRSVYYQTSVGAYQTQFDPPIPKTNVDVVSVSFRVGWARRP